MDISAGTFCLVTQRVLSQESIAPMARVVVCSVDRILGAMPYSGSGLSFTGFYSYQTMHPSSFHPVKSLPLKYKLNLAQCVYSKQLLAMAFSLCIISIRGFLPLTPHQHGRIPLPYETLVRGLQSTHILKFYTIL